MNRGKKNFPKIDDLKNEYDLFFTCMVPKIDDKFLNEDGKILFGGYGENDGSDGRKFKCLSAQIAKKGRDRSWRPIDTSDFWKPFGYEFDIGDRNFDIKMASYKDMATLPSHNDVPKIVQPFFIKQGFEHNDYIKATVDGKKNVYIWNQNKAKERKIDVRDVVIPKLISRIKKAKEISGLNFEEAKKKLYQKTNSDSYDDFDSSFTEENYGVLEEETERNEGFHTLSSMRLAISSDKSDTAFIAKHNEFCAYPKNNSPWVKPKRLIVDIGRVDYALEHGHIEKEDLSKFLRNYNEKYVNFYDKQIRIIDSAQHRTCLTTIDKLENEFKERKWLP